MSSEPDNPAPQIAQLPDWVYIFVNQGNNMAVMNLQITGRYSSPVLVALEDPNFRTAYLDGSADFLPYVPNPAVSTGFLSPFTASSLGNYRVEYDAELTRRTFFPDAPSRLTGIFAFESMTDCQRASERFGWDINSVQRFQSQQILKATRVNMEIVSLARLVYVRSAFDQASTEHLWRSYWGGEDNYAVDLPSVDATKREVHKVDATWEWIIDGSLLHESRVGST